MSQTVLFHMTFSAIFSFCIYEWEAPWARAGRRGVKDGAHRAEMKARAEATIKRGTRKKRQRSDQEATNYICSSCNKDCHSRIGLLSHSRAHQHWCADHRLSETRMPLFYICRKTTKLHCSWDIAHFLSKSSSGDQANGIHWSWWFSLFLITSSIVEKFMFLWPCTNILSNAILTNICGTHCGDDTRADLWNHW